MENDTIDDQFLYWSEDISCPVINPEICVSIASHLPGYGVFTHLSAWLQRYHTIYLPGCGDICKIYLPGCGDIIQLICLAAETSCNLSAWLQRHHATFICKAIETLHKSTFICLATEMSHDDFKGI